MTSSAKVDDHDLAYFLAEPWCASILNSPEYTIHPTRSRTIKSSGEDNLFAKTLNTSLTMPYCLTVSRSQNPSDPDSPLSEVRTFIRLETGLNGFPNVCHGGIVATIIDEIMGVGMFTYHQHKKAIEKRKGTYAKGARRPSMTAELTVKYLRPVKVPAIVSVVVWPVRYDGRKTWVETEIQDDKNVVLSKGKALFVQLKKANI